MKKVLLLMIALIICLIFPGCANKVSVYEIENGNGEVIFKIRNTPADDDYYSKTIELLDLNDNVIHRYDATEDTYLSYSTIVYNENLKTSPYSLSQRTFNHYGFSVDKTFQFVVTVVDRESKDTVVEDILSSDLKVLERSYWSKSSDAGVGTKKDKIELFLPDGRLFISCELSSQNKGKGNAQLDGITPGVKQDDVGNYVEDDYYVAIEFVDGSTYKEYYFDFFTGEPVDKPIDEH